MWSRGFRGTSRGDGDGGDAPQRPGEESKEDEEGGEAELRNEEGDTEQDEVSDWEMTPEERRTLRETGVRPARNPDNLPRRRYRRPTTAELATLANNPTFNFNVRTEEMEADILLGDVRRALHNGVDEDGTDHELRQVMADSFFSLSEAARPAKSAIVNGAVQWMGLTGRMDPRQAIFALAQANWDYRLATQRTFEEEGTLAPSREVVPRDHEEPDVRSGTGSGSELSTAPEDSEEGPDPLKLMRRLNPQVNKNSAKKGHRDDSKLTITLRNPGNKADSVYRYPLMVNGTIDFSSAARIRAVNRWRSQIFRRNLGVARPPRLKFHDLEKRFLYDAHIEFERQRRAAGQKVTWSKMDWDQVTRDFNARFKGQILPGNPDVRPFRTRDSLRTERSRIKEITDHTGITPRDQKQAPEESTEDEEEPQPRPKYPRRGDPAPGKPPTRRPDDSDESDSEGGEFGAGRTEIAA